MGKITRFFIASPENNYRPPVLSYKAFLIYGLILLLLRLFLGTLPAKSAAVESSTLMQLINQERVRRNLSSLFTHRSLVTAATQKSQDMIDRDFFAHVDPDGNYVWTRIVAAGYTPYQILGENLAIDFSTSEGMVQAWIDSPSHRANLLHPDFVDQGLAALYGDYQGRFTNLTTSLFGKLAQTQTPPPPAVKSQTPPVNQLPPATPQTQKIPSTTRPTSTTPIRQESKSEAPQEFKLPSLPKQLKGQPTVFLASRLIFTLFGMFLLLILTINSVLIYKSDIQFARGHPSYHLLGFILIVLITIFIWWW